jgi:hypothetical protein
MTTWAYFHSFPAPPSIAMNVMADPADPAHRLDFEVDEVP